MSGGKRLSHHDDRRGSALTLWTLWNLVDATEELDGDDPAITEEMWASYAHRIAAESEHPEDVPNLGSSLGPVTVDE